MTFSGRARPWIYAVALFSAATLVAAPRAVSAPAQTLPESIADSTFWRLSSEMSEPGGFFRSDNFASNEWSFQEVIPELLRTTRRGGVYLGVGPDQNYTYIVNLQPRIAFILDIRRQNMMLHLMYKALIETSPDRVTFAARLFGKVVPPGTDTTTSADALLNAVFTAAREPNGRARNLEAIYTHLVNKHGFRLSREDSMSIAYVQTTFDAIGPGITYQGTGGTPTYWDLQQEDDGVTVQRAYMASEANYRILKRMHERNLIVPVVGNFGGPKALRAIGSYLSEHKAPVTTFYLSNVEQYLFQSDDWYNFYSSVATLPLDSTSTFIRSVFNNQGGLRLATNGQSPIMLLGGMMNQVTLFKEGRMNSYQAVINSSR